MMDQAELNLLKQKLSFGRAVCILVVSLTLLGAGTLLLLNYITIYIVLILLITANPCVRLLLKTINRKINLDLKNQEKNVLKETVLKKEILSDVEAGSGNLYIPILCDLFPNIWGQKMKETKQSLIYTANGKYQIPFELYDKIEVENLIECHYAKESKVFLGISLIK